MTRVDARVRLSRPVVPGTDPATWLPAPSRPAGADLWKVAVAFGPFHHVALVHLGSPWVTDKGVGRTIAWSVAPASGDVLPFERLLPPAAGEVVITCDGAVELWVSYVPPAGWVGRVADLALKRLARRAVRQMANGIAEEFAAHGPAAIVG